MDPSRRTYEFEIGGPDCLECADATPEADFNRRVELAREKRDAERRRQESALDAERRAASRWTALEAELVEVGERLVATQRAAHATTLDAVAQSEVRPVRERRRWFGLRGAATAPTQLDRSHRAVPVGKGSRGTLYASFTDGRFTGWHESWETIYDWEKGGAVRTIDELVSPYEGQGMRRLNDRGKLEDVFPGQHSLDKRMAMTRRKVLDGFAAWAVENEIAP